jgi:predicted nucleic acid-binding protein
LSSGFLLDTSVLSILAPGRPEREASLVTWLQTRSDRLYVSAVTISEIEQGICKLRRAGGTERADGLARWLDALIDEGGDRILSFDAPAGRIAGALSDGAIATGRHPGFPDVAIAATAMAHDLILLTRNGRHFAPLGISFIDPSEGLPAT